LLSVECEGTVVGVAIRGDAGVEELRRALDAFRTDRVPNHNYTVWLSGDRRTFHRLQWGGCTVVRTRDAGRFGEALARHLSGHGAPSPGLVRTDGVVALHGERAYVFPASFRQAIPTFERPLRQAGVTLVDAPWVDLDPSDGVVALEPPRLAASHFAAMVDNLPTTARPDRPAEPGRYRIAHWYLGSLVPNDQSMSVADAIATVLAGLRNPLSTDDGPAALAAMFERIPFGRWVFQTPRELLDHLRP
jgi:hypothetical protein